MEILATITIVLFIVWGGICLNRFLDGKYNFSTFSGRTPGMATISVAAWSLVYFLYEPDSTNEVAIEVLAGLFIIIFGVPFPVTLLVRNIRETNFCLGFPGFPVPITDHLNPHHLSNSLNSQIE